MAQHRVEQYYDKRQIRQYVLGFLAMFTSIQINQAADPENDTPKIRQVPVKLTGPARIYEAVRDDNRFQVFPMIGIELLGLEYGDLERRFPKHEYISEPTKMTNDGKVLKTKLINTFHYAPYKFNWAVYLLSNTYRDMYILLEQILPVFNPEAYIEIGTDVSQLYKARTILTSVTDNSEKLPGASLKDRSLLYTLGFQTQGFLHKFEKEVETVRVVNTQVYKGDVNITNLLNTIIEEENS